MSDQSSDRKLRILEALERSGEASKIGVLVGEVAEPEVECFFRQLLLRAEYSSAKLLEITVCSYLG